MRWRYGLAIALLVLTVLVDFTSKMLSIAADGILAALAVYILWPARKDSNK